MNGFNKSQWAKDEFTREYRDNADIYVMERARMLNILKSFYSHFMKKDRKKSILDLGCGDGIIAYELLKTDGAISATLLDGSPDMLNNAKERLKGFEKVRYINASFQEFMRKTILEQKFGFIVSSLAIHHLTMKEKKALFRKIHAHLYPGGYFMNIDCILAPTGTLDQWYLSLWKEWIDEKKLSLGMNGDYFDDIIHRYKDNKDNKPDTLEDQLNALMETGFRETDCYYKYGIFAMFGGRK
jgi:tRNA (cmo5U34)-methyltransferase